MSETTKQVNDGGPAFPHIIKSWANDNISQPHAGMNLRDYFAAKAMVAILTSPMRDTLLKMANGLDMTLEEAVSIRAYEIADAMLLARESK